LLRAGLLLLNVLLLLRGVVLGLRSLLRPGTILFIARMILGGETCDTDSEEYRQNYRACGCNRFSLHILFLHCASYSVISCVRPANFTPKYSVARS
jgi:hypothetical protein